LSTIKQEQSAMMMIHLLIAAAAVKNSTFGLLVYKGRNQANQVALKYCPIGSWSHCHLDGEALLWDLDRQTNIAAVSLNRGGPGLAVKRMYSDSIVKDTSDIRPLIMSVRYPPQA
jgi:hypothetical protein